jgi:hypothetical protein
MLTVEDLKKIREYVYKKSQNVEDDYCKLGYYIDGEFKFFDICIEKERLELEEYLKTTED